MPRIMRLGSLGLSGEVVRIKDIAPAPKGGDGDAFEAEAAPRQNGGAAEPDAPEDASALEAAGEEGAAKRGGADAVRGEVIQGAMAEAGRIMAEAVRDAEAERERLFAEARAEAEQLRAQAGAEGRKEGYASVANEVRRCAAAIEAAIAAFEGSRAGFEAEYEDQLRWLAIEIAGKVLAKKVDGDDAVMSEMVQKAVQSIKNEPWIRVEVSGEMTGLITSLLAVYEGQVGIEVNAVPLPAGTVHIESPSGVVDASLRTQLENLREYFSQPQA